MLSKFKAYNTVDEHGNPTGGSVTDIGLAIVWQNGPLGRGNERQEPNGASVETVIAAVIQRLEFFQQSKFNCVENVNATSALRSALDMLISRTFRREAKGVEGTHEV